MQLESPNDTEGPQGALLPMRGVAVQTLGEYIAQHVRVPPVGSSLYDATACWVARALSKNIV
jgi:hypothetical protein